MLLFKIRPSIEGQTTHLRKPISPEEKLAVTLRFLATGESYNSLQYQFRIHETTISKFIPKVCDGIYNALKDEYFTCPNTENEWMKLAQGTEERWQFPNAFAAADGKHISIYHPKDSGASFYNYKGFYSIVLMALVDFDYKFVFADVGCQGRISDGGVYRNSELSKLLSQGALNLPAPRSLPKSMDPAWEPFTVEESLPFVFVGDNAFPLTTHCLKPYPDRALTDRKRVFNYRLSRFRRVTENAFGILTSVFRIFSTKINLCPDTATKVVLASLVLHNLLRTKSPESYTPSGFADEVEGDHIIEGQWRKQTTGSNFKALPPRRHGNNQKKTAEEYRDIFADHFYGPGQVPWQWKCLTATS